MSRKNGPRKWGGARRQRMRPQDPGVAATSKFPLEGRQSNVPLFPWRHAAKWDFGHVLVNRGLLVRQASDAAAVTIRFRL
jgi:hypothetical protein